ncbi:NAD(P)-dependent alcohol dehydrogenase [Streptomyces sp. SCSIO 30461]|uniref:NAD(P)-dependent alcohol dehydrogenase n=1 Tax=Streptomyces sp. SCSIO 30461 TaxID=3118085 RepID=UPI0030D54EB6
MKAIVQDMYGSADVLELRDVDKPADPAIGGKDVLIRVRAAAVDAGVWHLMRGRPYLVRLMGYGLRAPKERVRGREVAGVVEAVGGAVTRFRPGDEVFGFCEGAFAEYVRAPEDRFLAKPENLGFEESAAVPISGVTALQAVRDAGRVRPGQRVLVIGAAGGVGTYAVQLAKAYGAAVTGVCSTAKTELVRSIGADEVIDYTREDLPSTGRYDVIVDTAGHRSLALLRRVLAPRGTLVIVGSEGGGRWLGGTDRVLRAALLSPFTGQRLRGLMSVERTADLEVLRDLIETGKVRPVIDRTHSLSEVPEVIRRLERGNAKGKSVISV